MNGYSRGPGPFAWLIEHQTLITRLLALLGIVILAILIANRLARRVGGWYVVRRRVRREIRLTTVAFTTPARRWARYRRQVRLLSRRLCDPDVWEAGERAMRAVDAVTPEDCHPYATVVGTETVGVFIAGRDIPEPEHPWAADDSHPNLWWGPLGGSRVPPVHERERPPRAMLLTALGVEGTGVLFFDLIEGPPIIALSGEPQAAAPVLQALAAQLDQRLPPGAVTVADGVHPRHRGPDTRHALEIAASWQHENSTPAFAVYAEPVPKTAEAGGPYALVRGRVRGHTRLMRVNRHGHLVVLGTPLQPDANALPRAVARTIGSLPPYRPPAIRAEGEPMARHPQEEVSGALGRSATAPAAPGETVSGRPIETLSARPIETLSGRPIETLSGRAAEAVSGRSAGSPAAASPDGGPLGVSASSPATGERSTDGTG